MRIWFSNVLLLAVALAGGGAHADPAPPDTAPATPSPSPATPPAPDTVAPPAAPEDYAIHGQTTFTDQYHPAFASAHSGRNSLDPGSRGNETWDVTLYGGWRPWRGAELWVDPEVDQGYGISNTVGLAAYSSGEAYKIGASVPYVRIPRLFLRQTIDLGGETTAVAPDLNVLGGSTTANRVVATIGKFGVVDVFDTNTYGQGPRTGFLNWAAINAGAFDYVADAWGFTYGASLEWYQDWWTLRAGVFDGSVAPNSKFLETRFGAQFQMVQEAEARYTIAGQAGKVKILGFETRAKLATFSQLAAFYAANPDDTIEQAEVVRHLRNKFGGEINLEQAITADLAAFMRASFNDGRTESYEFTDITRSISTGLTLAGTSWNRPDDSIGIVAIINNTSHVLKEYLAAGYYGILIGDGRLTNAAPEQVIEAYYSFLVHKGVSVTADYQVANHPAYNSDRGPVSILGMRLHAQF